MAHAALPSLPAWPCSVQGPVPPHWDRAGAQVLPARGHLRPLPAPGDGAWRLSPIKPLNPLALVLKCCPLGAICALYQHQVMDLCTLALENP
jgi:hypothetical protein